MSLAVGNLLSPNYSLNVQARFFHQPQNEPSKKINSLKEETMISLKVETFSLVYNNIRGLNRTAAISELEKFIDSYPTDLVALVET